MPRHTILLVDDDAVVRKLSAGVLSGAGFDVLEAGSGPQALQVARAHQGTIGLLLTDVELPGMSGGELAEALAKERPDVPTVFMSGYSAGAALHDSVRDEGVAFIAKPFNPEALLRKVRAALRGA